MSQTFSWFILIWTFILLGSMCVGGYFMFRKFLKVLPKDDGMSKLDWQNYYVDKSRHLWTEESKSFLDLLVSPVPKAFRDIAKHSIAASIGKIALEKKAEQVTIEHCIEGYIRATPKRDHKFLVKFLRKKNIDFQLYEHLLDEESKA